MLSCDLIMRHCNYLGREELAHAMEIVLGRPGYVITLTLEILGMFGSLIALFIYMTNCIIGMYSSI